MNCSTCKTIMGIGREDGKEIRYCRYCGKVVQIPMAGPTTQHSSASRARTTADEPVSRNKYGAVKTELDGITFDSKAEANRYCELKLMEKAGLISHLVCQHPMPLTVNGIYCGKYTADFRYRDAGDNEVIEDVKSKPSMTEAYRLRKRLVEAIYKVKITEIGGK